MGVTSGIEFNSLARARSPGRRIECVAGIALGSLAKVVAQGKLASRTAVVCSGEKNTRLKEAGMLEWL